MSEMSYDPVNIFRRSLYVCKPLSIEEERRLYDQLKQPDMYLACRPGKAYIEARNRLAEAILPWCYVRIASRIKQRDEATMLACDAAMCAAETFDPDKGRLSTWAAWCCMKVMSRYCKSRLRDQKWSINCAIVGDKALGSVLPASPAYDPAVNAVAQEDHEDEERVYERVRWALATLPQRHADIVLAYVCGNQTLQEVGRTHGITRERVRQLVQKTLNRLKTALLAG